MSIHEGIDQGIHKGIGGIIDRSIGKNRLVNLRIANPRSLTRCRVCGFAEVRTDEVLDPELLFLAECPRCENRWTSRQPMASPWPIATPSRSANPLPLATRRFERVPARVTRTLAPAA